MKPGQGSSFSESGFRLRRPGPGSNLIQRSYADEFWRALNPLGRMEIEIVPTGKPKVIYSDGRTVFKFPLSALTGSGSGSLACYKVKSDGGNYLVCRTWNGTAEGPTDVNVAKPHGARQPASETLGGVTYNYTYSSGPDSLNDQRESDDGSTQEDQIVTPLWTVDGLIQVMQTNFSGVTVSSADLKLIEVSARCWAKIEAP